GLRRMRLVVGKVDPPVLPELRVERDVIHAALVAIEDWWDAGHRLRIHGVAGDDAHSPSALGDQDPAIGQEGHAVRTLEPLDWHHTKLGAGNLHAARPARCAVENDRRGPERLARGRALLLSGEYRTPDHGDKRHTGHANDFLHPHTHALVHNAVALLL